MYNVLSILQASGEAQYVSDMIVSNALAAAFVLSTEVHTYDEQLCVHNMSPHSLAKCHMCIPLWVILFCAVTDTCTYIQQFTKLLMHIYHMH